MMRYSFYSKICMMRYSFYSKICVIEIQFSQQNMCDNVTVVGTLTLEGTLTAALLARQVEKEEKRCNSVPIRTGDST
jgi:hypothetical protein